MIDISNLNKSINELYIDFDLSLGKGSRYFKQIENYVGRNKKIYEMLKALYKQNNFLNVKPRNEARIPKIIHHIWIGDRPLPPTYKNCKFKLSSEISDFLQKKSRKKPEFT
ncbi:MAG: hypothetical protein GY928_40560 [Colwellia sp.]|nr:hypothetical protein [Colwellia sp.]